MDGFDEDGPRIKPMAGQACQKRLPLGDRGHAVNRDQSPERRVCEYRDPCCVTANRLVEQSLGRGPQLTRRDDQDRLASPDNIATLERPFGSRHRTHPRASKPKRVRGLAAASALLLGRQDPSASETLKSLHRRGRMALDAHLDEVTARATGVLTDGQDPFEVVLPTVEELGARRRIAFGNLVVLGDAVAWFCPEELR